MQNFFELFAIAAAYSLQPSALKSRYIELQKQWHPDTFPQGLLKQKAEQQTALINEAYEHLSCPVLRAQHLLCLQGDIPAVNLPNAFLQQQFMLRESLEQAIEQRQTAAIVSIQDQAQTELNALEEQMSEWFVSAKTESIAEAIQKMQFWQKMIIECNEYSLKQLS